MFSPEKLDIMDGLTGVRYFSNANRANFGQHPTLRIPIIKPAGPKVTTPVASVKKIDSASPSLLPVKAENTTHCSSTTPKESTVTKRFSGLVISSDSGTSRRDATGAIGAKSHRPLVGFGDAHMHNIGKEAQSNAASVEDDTVKNRLTITKSLAGRVENDVQVESTSVPSIPDSDGAFGKVAGKTTGNIVEPHDPDKPPCTKTVYWYSRTRKLKPSTYDEMERDCAVANLDTGGVQAAASAELHVPKRKDISEKHHTATVEHTACSSNKLHDSKTGYGVKSHDVKKSQDARTMSDANSTTQNVNPFNCANFDFISVNPRSDPSPDVCTDAVAKVALNVSTISKRKPLTKIDGKANPNRYVAGAIFSDDGYTAANLPSKSSEIQKSEITDDYQVVIKLHDTPKDMNKQTVSEYLSDISAYKLNEMIVRITELDGSTGTIAVSVKCPTQELQTNFLDAVKQSGHSVCAKQKASVGGSTNGGKCTEPPTIKLRVTMMICKGLQQEDIDKAVVVEYIKMVTGVTLAAGDVERDGLSCAAADRCVYRITSVDKDTANALTDSINEVSETTGMTAALLTDNDLEIQGLWDEVFNRGREQVTLHHEKASEISEELNRIDNESSDRGGRKRYIVLEEYERRLARKAPLQSKLQELKSQELEFAKYMDRLQLQIFDLKGGTSLKRAVQRLRTEFKLEMDRFRSALPMYARKTSIVDTVRSNRVSIILGETGSGKSTQILQYLHEAGFTNEGLIVCTQPRKVAALSLARRVAEEMGCKVGQLVGYQVGMQSKRSEETKLLYVTDHILLNECLKDPLFSRYACLVIDEAHERSIYTDLLLGFIKRSLARRDDLKVIITSATIDPKVFIKYFNGNPPVVEVSGRAFPVDVIYEKVDYGDEEYLMAAVDKSLWVHENNGPGDVLVFLTSPIETEKACNMLKNSSQRSVIALELNGRLQLEEQQKVFDPTPPGKRKIVFATNSAETSVTIPGIKYVIDTGKIREMNYDAKRNMSVLGLTLTTKSSADQRKGRAGRTDSGYCYRLYKADTYDKMRSNSVPEILRIHLGQALLKLLMLGIDDPRNFQFVESPKLEAIEEALSVLEELGAYSIEVGITEIGKKLSQIAVEPRLGKVALRGIEEGIGYEAMIIAAVCSAGGSVFFRGGSADDKQASDRTKTKFCDEWGDMITGAMIFKEWEQLPLQSRGGWCKVNSINGKTMKVAKDSLKEILQTFQQDLKMIVDKKFSNDPKVNEKLARILLDCYPSQLARFLGHERIGYCLANNPKQTLRLHPSSSLLYMKTPPTWVIYQQILNTSDIFMTNVTFVDESWIDERLSNGKLKIDLDQLREEIICPDKFSGLGKQCIFKLLDKKAQALRDLEDGIKAGASSGESARLSIQLDTNRKSIVMYADRNIRQVANDKVQSFLDEVRNSLRDETIEERIRKTSNVRFVLGSGLQIKSILMPGEQRQLAIFCSQTQTCRMEEVCEVLQKYGEIESSMVNRQQNSPVFGYVTFKNAADAEAAFKYRSSLNGFRVEISLKDTSGVSKSRSANFSVKVEVCRRPLTGFGYVQFHSDAVVNRVLDKTDSVNISTKIGQNRIVEATVQVSENRKNYDQIRLNDIPDWATPNMIRCALEEVVGRLKPGQDMLNVVLVRKPAPPPNASQRIFQMFRGQIMQELIGSEEFSARDFEVQMNEPKDKDFTMSAYLRFEDPDKAADAADLLDGLSFLSQEIEARLDLKASFIVSDKVYGTCKKDVEDEIDRLNRASSSGVVQIKMERRKNGSYLIQVETSELEDLKEARTRLDELIYGHRVDMDSSKYAQLKTEAAMRKRDDIQKRARVRIRLDDRQEVVFIYGQRESVEKAKRLLDEYLSQTKANVTKEICLKDGGYPRGIMKTLVGQYGSNLEKLKSMCCAFSLELNLKRRAIRFHGTQESYEQLKALIEKLASQIPGPRIEPEPAPDCSVCLINIDYDDCYVLEFCGHYYCNECARNLVGNGLSNNTIPLRCIVEDCGKDLVLKDFQNLLPRMEETFDPAIRSFMATCDKEFAYCTTPDCPMIYRKGKKVGEEFVCSECHVSICTKCDNSFHPGMSCETYCSFFVKADDEIKTWLMGDPVRRALCPKCGVGIEKNEGCNHVECKACKAHICWKCKKHFTESSSCYQHLTKKHGGFYDGGDGGYGAAL